MKQKIKQLQSFVLLLILSVVGTANVWGDTVTFSYDVSNTISSNTWTHPVITDFELSGSSLSWKSGTENFKLATGTYTIKVPAEAIVSNITIGGQSDANDPSTITIGETGKTFSNSGDEQSYDVTHSKGADISLVVSNKGANVSSIVLTYTSGGGEPTGGYSITYNANTMADGSTPMATAPASAGDQTALPNPLPSPTSVRTGYTFVGWYTDAALTTEAVAGATLSDDATLYAEYKINTTSISPADGTIAAGATLTVTPQAGVTMTQAYRRYSNGSTFSNLSDFVTNKSTGAANSSAATSMLTSTTFAATTSTGNTRKLSWVITDGKWYSSPQNTTYKVVNAYTVTYNGNGNTGGSVPVDSNSPYASGATVTVLDNTGSLVKTNYTFNGWNTASNGSGNAYDAGDSFDIADNTVLYAQWTLADTDHTITINANGGTGGSASVTATSGEALPSFTAPIRSGYVLTGYYTASSAGTKVINADGSLVPSTTYANSDGEWIGTTDVEFYAQWAAVYTVTFNATTNGGTCDTPSLTQESAGASIILPNAAKEDNTFNGWFTAATGGESVGVAGDSYIPTANVTLYAQFSEIVSGTKFSMVCVRTTDMSTEKDASEYVLTSSEATITGSAAGTAAARRADGSAGKFISSNNSGCFIFNNSNLYYHIHLTNPLAQGDVISYTGYNSAQIAFTTSTTAPTSSSPRTSEYSYTIPSGSDLIGVTDLYMWRASGSATYFNDFTITGSSQALTYSVSFDLATMADDIEALEDQIALPNPLPTPTNVASGYTFEGWYTNDTYTTRATAGAAIKTNTTLYANYIIDTPTISQDGGEIYAGTALSMSGNVPFTQVYAQWKGDDAAFDKATAIADPTRYRVYNSDAIDTYNFTCADGSRGTRYFAYMVSDGKFYSVPAVTNAYLVKNLITITKQPESATYIKNATPSAISITASVTGSGDNAGTLSYQWKECATEDGEYVNVTAGSGGTTASYTPVTTSTGTTYFKCYITSNNEAAPVETKVVSVTVNESAIFTVSFDAGVGSIDTPSDATQASADESINLPTLTLKNVNYQFVGWYLDDAKVADADATTYTPSGNVTLVAKYNCKVVLERVGNGNLPTAKIKSTNEPIASGEYVFEGTEITLTASPADKFIEWDYGMTGTTNPKDYVVNDYKLFRAKYEASENTTLFHTDFTESGWSSINGVNGGGVATNVGDGGNQTVTLEAGSGVSYGWTSGTLTYAPNNYNSSNYIAIPVSGVNGALEITVANGSSKTQFKYNVVLGSSTDNPGSGTSSTSGTPSTVTVNALTASNYVVYIGRQSGSYTKITEITITTPTTKLAADSAQVRILGTNNVVAPVQISTNSTGTISIKTDPNGSVAEASYNSGSKVLTITSKGEGTTSVVMQITADGSHPARELTIPITVEAKKITIKTQPTNISCYQNDVSEKKFTVVATVNTGGELTYQWYSNTAASTTTPSPTLITGATSSSYTLNTTDKATVGNKYFFCKISSTGCDDVYTDVKSVTISALTDDQTYNANVFVGTKGNVLTYTGLGTGTTITSGGDSDKYTASITSGTLTITGAKVGEGTIVLSTGTTINVTVKKHTIQLIWSAESKEYDVSNTSVWVKDKEFTIGSGANDLPYLTRLYEDGTAYTGRVDFYLDDSTIAYFGDADDDPDEIYSQTDGSTKPTIRYGGGQGGCKFYAFIDDSWSGDAEEVKASYDLRLIKGISNALPSGRKVAVQQQYTLYKNATDKLVTVTYGGYKYNNGTWSGKTDSWGTATNYVGKDNAIDGFLYAVRNKERDASDEYMHAIQDEDDFGSAWYASGEGGTTAAYQRIKPFRLPCRASYLTFTAHKSGTLTAYVYQNGIIGRGGNANQLASAPRLGYWFDEEGWVQEPVGTVVTKQTIAKNNARDKRVYESKNNDAQIDAYWKNDADAIVIKKLRSKYCSVEHPNKNTPEAAFSDTKAGAFQYDNPYYWGTEDEIATNLAKVIPTPERPIPHQGGHMIVNEGYVKYTINVEAGKTYYFFGKMTKVGYAGMTFVEADSENRQSSRVDLATDDKWSEKFDTHASSVLVGDETTIYDEITVPSNYRIGKWNTICLPFAVNENQVEQVFGKDTELAIFNGLRHDTENHVYYIKYLRHVDQNILPGQPYLIYPTGRAVEERTNQENGGMVETGEDVATVGDSDPIIGSTIAGSTRLTFRNVIINKGITAQSYGCDVDADGTTTSYVFTGTDQQKAIEKYDLYNTPKTGELKRYMGAGTTLNTYHALIKASSEEIKKDAITFAFTEEDIEKSWESNIDDEDPGEATGIVIIEDEGFSEVRNSGRVTNGKSYNMMGQEVDPTSAKGIILINGKKVMY